MLRKNVFWYLWKMFHILRFFMPTGDHVWGTPDENVHEKMPEYEKPPAKQLSKLRMPSGFCRSFYLSIKVAVNALQDIGAYHNKHFKEETGSAEKAGINLFF